MTEAKVNRAGRTKKSLRRRMVVSLLSLALLPMTLAMAGLFLVVNGYVAEIQRLQPALQLHEQFISLTMQTAFLLVLSGGVVAALAWRLADQLLLPIMKIRLGAEIVARINLSHRIELDSGDELEDLALEFNHMAENLGTAYGELEGRVREATRTLHEERNRLATVLRTMVDGVVVTNEATMTILMNPRARIMLDLGYTSGIGTHLSRILPGDRLDFHLNRIRRSWTQGRETVEDVLFPLPDGRLLKGSLSVVPGNGGEQSGYLLVFRDLSSPGGERRKSEEALRDMTQQLRGPLGACHSLVESLQRHREMPEEKQITFLAAVAQEMNRLSAQVTAIDDAANAARSVRWPAIPSGPRELVEEALRLVPELQVRTEADDTPIPQVLVEPFSWVSSLCCVLHWIKANSPEPPAIGTNLRVEDGTVVTTFRISGRFNGNPAELDAQEVSPSGEPALTLGVAVRKNRGELWTRSSGEAMEVRLALLQADTAAGAGPVNGLPNGEPVFYDFDLFLPRPVVERADQLRADLSALDYVVFDTETTGMQLSLGDKIISISGVRIRHGHIQNAEVFHSLVNPGRLIPPESFRFHHIDDHMVADAPSISLVYPQFVDFVGDAILVAHNAAFDKKCLENAAAEAAMPMIDNPILDTLFLSYGIHEESEGHSLDAIAARLGITIEGRHSSQGDARATARVFLALISLLPGRGVHTLAEAKAFCDRHLLLRWQSSRF